MIGALLFDMLLLSRGLLLSFADLLNSAGFDIRVVSGEGLAARLPIADSARLADDIRRLPDVEHVLLIRIEPATVRATGKPPRGISLIGSSDAEQSWRIVKGSSLASPAAAAEACPVLVTRPLAAALGLAPGDSRIDQRAAARASRRRCRLSPVGYSASPTLPSPRTTSSRRSRRWRPSARRWAAARLTPISC